MREAGRQQKRSDHVHQLPFARTTLLAHEPQSAAHAQTLANPRSSKVCPVFVARAPTTWTFRCMFKQVASLRPAVVLPKTV